MILLSLGLVGLFTCWQFWNADRQARSGKKPMDIICADSSCYRISKTPYGRLLVLPNWMFGTAYYLLVVLAGLLGQAYPWLLRAAAAAALVSLCVSLYLIWALIFRLDYFCRSCYLAHLTNILLAALLAGSLPTLPPL